MDAIGGHPVKWSKPDLERQRPHVFSHIWKIDTIQIQAILWKTYHTKWDH
jgi:hypothetical protein